MSQPGARSWLGVLLWVEPSQATTAGQTCVLWQPSLSTGPPKEEGRREQGKTKRQEPGQTGLQDCASTVAVEPRAPRSGMAPAAGQALSCPDLNLSWHLPGLSKPGAGSNLPSEVLTIILNELSRAQILASNMWSVHLDCYF